LIMQEQLIPWAFG